ncbi:putative cyclin-F2-1 [Phragmites australis]|uniref:putative cyclin-F2-1 n=1 Tax=Phragmites australis TaxID=29695 RepID=UPI002D7713DB|nr:putative cyclin-F2-1 [Phragmites australis]
MATSYVEVPAALYGYDDDADAEALLRGIDAVVHAPTPADLTPQPVADGTGDALPMSSVEFLALSRQDTDADLKAFLRYIRSVHVPATGLAPVAMADEATPTTPLAVLGAPRGYCDDDAAASATIKSPSKKQPEPFETYDDDIDASLRAMEKDPTERPTPLYLWTTQAGKMTMVKRAELVSWMHDFAGCYDLAPGALHRSVSYVDRFLSAKKIWGSCELRLLGAVAVFTAAKYEDRRTTWALDADNVARHAGCTRREVVYAECELVAALGYRLSGPTAYTFIDHFTRHGQEEEGTQGSAVRSLAHHLADLALLDYRCVQFLPSVVAASAIVLARLAVDSAASGEPGAQGDGRLSDAQMKVLEAQMLEAKVSESHMLKHDAKMPEAERLGAREKVSKAERLGARAKNEVANSLIENLDTLMCANV